MKLHTLVTKYTDILIFNFAHALCNFKQCHLTKFESSVDVLKFTIVNVEFCLNFVEVFVDGSVTTIVHE